MSPLHGAFAVLPEVRLVVELGPFGWSFSIYDRHEKQWIISAHPAASEAEGRELAEEWAQTAGDLEATAAVHWVSSKK